VVSVEGREWGESYFDVVYNDEEGEGKKSGRTSEPIRAQASPGNYGYDIRMEKCEKSQIRTYVKWSHK